MNWLLKLFFAFSLFFSSSAKCPDGTVEFIADPSICYLFNTTKQAFLIAEESCIQNNGHLVSINNMLENSFISEKAQQLFTDSTTADYWIGITKLLTPGTWGWIDGAAVAFTDWDKGEPQNVTGYDCGAAKLAFGMWHSDYCEFQKPFVCKVAAIPGPSTPTGALTATTSAFTTTTTKPKSCPNTWKSFEATNSCYKILYNLSWQDAEKACFSEGAHLASIHSLDENNFVTNMIPFNPNNHKCRDSNLAWIGLYTVDQQASWQWTDDSSFTFSAWALSKVPVSTHSCAYLWNGPACGAPFGTWGDGWCPAKVGFSVCKKLLLN